jgi:hypothetical protein
MTRLRRMEIAGQTFRSKSSTILQLEISKYSRHKDINSSVKTQIKLANAH